jgi:hypothetical protein
LTDGLAAFALTRTAMLSSRAEAARRNFIFLV